MTTPQDVSIEGLEAIEPLAVASSATYRAHHTASSREVVLRILDRRTDPLLPRRFELKRRGLASFTATRGVVPVLDGGVLADGHPYLVLPYYPCGSLEDRLTAGQTHWHQAAEVVAQTARTVGIAHDLGLALGDLRPSSVLMADADTPVISVYGMATHHHATDRVSYAAPETLVGHTPTPAADVYSLCLILAALIAGRHPDGHPLQPRFLARVAYLAPARLYQVIEYGLSPEVSRRYNHAARLARALVAALAGGPSPDAPVDRIDDPGLALRVRGADGPSPHLADDDPDIGDGSAAGNGRDTDGEPWVIDLRPGSRRRSGPDTARPAAELGSDSGFRIRDRLAGETSAVTLTLAPPASRTSPDDAPTAGTAAGPEIEARAGAIDARRDTPTATDGTGTDTWHDDGDPDTRRDQDGPERAGTRTEAPGGGGAATSPAPYDQDAVDDDPEPDNRYAVDDGRPGPDGLHDQGIGSGGPVDDHLGGADLHDPPAGDDPGSTETDDSLPTAGLHGDTNDPGATGPTDHDTYGDVPPAAADHDVPTGHDHNISADHGHDVPADHDIPADHDSHDHGASDSDSHDPDHGASDSDSRENDGPARDGGGDHGRSGTGGGRGEAAGVPLVPARPAQSGLSDPLGLLAVAHGRLGRADLDRPAAPPAGSVDLTFAPARPTTDTADDPGAAPVPGGPPPRPFPSPWLESAPDDATMPFRPHEPTAQLPTARSGRFVDLVDWLGTSLVTRRRSLGGVLAVLSLVMVAVVAIGIVLRDVPLSPPEDDPAMTSPVPPEASITTVAEEPPPPTSVVPAVVEPPSTHENTTVPGVSPETIAPAAPSTVVPTTSLAPTTTTAAPTTATAAAPTTAPPTTAKQPSLISEAAVSRIRPTSARVSFTSSACVTTSFSYAAEGRPAAAVSGGSTCSSAHALLLGQVTAPLDPGTTYSVTIMATDQQGRTSSETLTFTTLG